MKTLFIPAYRKTNIPKNILYNITGRLADYNSIAVVYSIQYKHLAEKIAKSLSKSHKISLFQQVLGCSSPRIPKITKAILLVSNGKFHAISLFNELKGKIPIYIYDEGKFERINEDEINIFKAKKKSAYLKYLHADKIGILISTKPGQENLKKAIQLKSKIKNKKSYLFLANNINHSEFENFSEIQSWVNTACKRLSFDYPFIDAEEINRSSTY